MTFADLIRQILRAHPEGMTPQEVRDFIKTNHPEFYGTETHRRNVERGHNKDLDHALLAQIYVASRAASDIVVDKSQKPLRLILPLIDSDPGVGEEDIESENLERLEAGLGTLYVLGTSLFTTDGQEIVKIGITTGSVENRVAQLYTTGVPFRFQIITQLETKNYAELEQALHKLLDPYRINRSREFFTKACLPYIEKIVSIHMSIQHEA